ncbi:MAG TPA: hypothetical protein VMS17_26180 [Gemmataceae bacterium]|nr:hypothetical protein [Gemmataceae bacterium]
MKSSDTRFPQIPWLDAQHFENRRNFPSEELSKYEGRHIAWSWDGAQILASGKSQEAVEEELKALGVDPSRVVFDYVFPGDASVIGPLEES